MIRKNTKLKVKRKNPSPYKYGYHITADKNLKSIMDEGFVRRLETRYPLYSIEIAHLIYGGKIPNYFLTTKSLDYLTFGFREYFYNTRENISMLKVNIETFNQLPDLDYLIMDTDFKFIYDYDDKTPSINFLKKREMFGLDDRKKSDVPSKLRKYINSDGKIPIVEFKTNPKLILDTIATTHTLCIAEDIPFNYIEDVIQIK